MSTEKRILIVSDNPTERALLGLICQVYGVRFEPTAAQALAAADAQTPDLILIALRGGDLDLCRTFKDGPHRDVPVLVLSRDQDPSTRFRAFSAGADDCLGVPFDIQEFSYKVQRIFANQSERTRLRLEADDAQRMVLNAQQQAAHIQSIGRFLQACLFCANLDALVGLLFHTLRGLGVTGVVRILRDGEPVLTRSDVGEPTVLETEILKAGSGAGRIVQFGHGRALFNWGPVQLLVRNVKETSDTLALLMDGVASGVTFIDKEARFMEALAARQEETDAVRRDFAYEISGLSLLLKDMLLSLSFQANLNETEEGRLNDLIDTLRNKFEDLMTQLDSHNQQLLGAARAFRAPASDADQPDPAAPTDDIELF